MENLPVKLHVLYGEDGRIVSLTRVRTDDESSAMPPMRSGVEPGKGQRLAVIAVDETLHGWPLKDIHEQFSISEQEGRPRLVQRSKSATAR